MKGKRYFRCYVCNDVHHGVSAPSKCPTCNVDDAYVEIDYEEAVNFLADEPGRDGLDVDRDKEELKNRWKNFSDKNDFVLNPDENMVDNVVKGVLGNEKEMGLKICPCRLSDGSRKRDAELICPCNFKAQETWKEEGRCWCGLFVKEE